MVLRADLLGGARFTWAGAEVKPRSRKGTALLAYLCLSGGPVRREDLAELLWGAGRLANLRQELYELRRLPGAAEWLKSGDETVAVVAETDVAELEADGAWHGDAAGLRLLPGLGRVDAPAFRDWLDQERPRVAALAARAWRQRAERLEEEGRYDEALAVVDAALAADPLDEALHRVGMRCAYLAGDRAAALMRFEACRGALRREVGGEPSAETTRLTEAIGRGERLVTTLDPGRLGTDLQPLVEALAVAGEALDGDTLAKVVGREPEGVSADLVRLERGGWLDDHLALVPEAASRALRTMPAATRRWLHHRLAEALGASTGSSPATVAEHLLGAGRPAEAAPLLVAAAETIAGEADPATAVPYVLRAMWASWEDRATRLRAALLLEGCASRAGDGDLQEAALAVAEELAWESQSDEALAEVRMRRSRWLLRRARVADGLERALEALEIAVRLGDERLLARARNAVGAAQFFAGDLDGAEESFRANVEVGDVVERYRARNNLGSIAGIKGQPHQALGHLEAALTLARATGQTSDVVGTLNNLAATAERFGEYRRAVRYLKESLSLARRSGSTANEGHVLVNLSVTYTRLGELGPAWNTACEVEELAGEHDHPRLALLAREQKAEVASLCGRLETALAELAAAEEVVRELGDERKEAALRVSRAVAEARRDPGLLGSAAAALAEAGDPRLADLEPWFWLDLATTTLDAADATAWTDRAAGSGVGGAHLRAYVALARLRAGLLEGASAAQVEMASRALSELVGEVEGRGYQGQLEFVQAPHARLLVGLWRRPTPGGEAPADDGVLRAVMEELRSQAAGLPRELATGRLAMPAAWSLGLGGPPLTPG